MILEVTLMSLFLKNKIPAGSLHTKDCLWFISACGSLTICCQPSITLNLPKIPHGI